MRKDRGYGSATCGRTKELSGAAIQLTIQWLSPTSNFGDRGHDCFNLNKSERERG